MKTFKVGQLVNRRERHYDWIGQTDPFTVETVHVNDAGYTRLTFKEFNGSYHGNSFNVVKEPELLPEELFTL